MTYLFQRWAKTFILYVIDNERKKRREKESEKTEKRKKLDNDCLLPRQYWIFVKRRSAEYAG